MKRRYVNGDEERLAAELRGEAGRGGPGYSQILHERIMRGVRTAGDGVEMKGGGVMRWSIGAAAAAVIVVGLWMWGRGPVEQGGQVSPGVVAKKEIPGVPAVDEIFERTAASAYAKLEAKLDEVKLAYLDDDAKQLARFVLDRTSVLPVGE
ncbi:MAG: hypothetical protein NTU53_02025 [Planctomycetota bacterium]|nr:hypothetical protein [Planctomycetota bacterium]